MAQPFDYKGLKQLAVDLGRPVGTPIVLSSGNDPFYANRPARRAEARWFAELWRRLGFGPGTHLRRVHYWLDALGERFLDGKAYENTDNSWKRLREASSKDARWLGLVPFRRFVERKLVSMAVATPGIEAPRLPGDQQRALVWLRDQPFATRKLWAANTAEKGADVGKAATAPDNLHRWVGSVAAEITAIVDAPLSQSAGRCIARHRRIEACRPGPLTGCPIAFPSGGWNDSYQESLAAHEVGHMLLGGTQMVAESNPVLSIVMPCLDEARTVGICIRKAGQFLASSGIAGEIIVADNGSSDGSQEMAHDPGARVVPVARRGYGDALRAGILVARGDYVVMGGLILIGFVCGSSALIAFGFQCISGSFFRLPSARRAAAGVGGGGPAWGRDRAVPGHGTCVGVDLGDLYLVAAARAYRRRDAVTAGQARKR
jgi:hypothetical protein